ncbi:Single-stranded DNA-binding replication protein A (RPA), large subunit [Methanonatronarchaeum thermophilum]|uniref:Single-stranded DNA-binding replication protein A (RPA), large subunit n=1 Tax=Methanonatronarchaeum thermophilum TaxID=1927129 RepID=A0A1Y3GBU6_9EURY|nr:hypothetical protein [Methanonatronarchaeum thermophilum]OUJ18727.1 Single-stranded DNA-binding replication protein A (RPA), large subunit [Methanonatronarchaeum thermophilum]
MNNKVEEALEELKGSISDFDESEIREEVEDLILKYKVPKDQAVSTILRKHTGTTRKTVGQKNISELNSGDSGVEITGRILRVVDREIEVDSEPRSIRSGTIADKSGSIDFTAWRDFPFEENSVVEIKNAYVKEYRNRPELQIGDYAEIREPSESDLPTAEQLKKPIKVDLDNVDRVYTAEVEAEIVEVMERSGLIMRCPECNRVTMASECQEHGKVDTIPDLRIKAVLDDGVGAIQATMPKEIVETMVGITLDEAMEMAREEMDKTVVYEEVKKVVGKSIVTVGRAIGNNFLVMDYKEVSWDPEEKAKQILQQIKEA